MEGKWGDLHAAVDRKRPKKKREKKILGAVLCKCGRSQVNKQNRNAVNQFVYLDDFFSKTHRHASMRIIDLNEIFGIRKWRQH